MTFQHRGELRADPGIAPGERNIDPPRRRSIWPSIAVVAAASAFGGVIWYAYHQSPGAGGNGMPPLVKLERGRTIMLALRNETAWLHPVHQETGRVTWWNKFPIMECGLVVRNTPVQVREPA